MPLKHRRDTCRCHWLTRNNTSSNLFSNEAEESRCYLLYCTQAKQVRLSPAILKTKAMHTYTRASKSPHAAAEVIAIIGRIYPLLLLSYENRLWVMMIRR